MKAMILILGLLSFLGGAHAEQTAGEQVKAGAKTAKRKMKKGANRMSEAACGNLTGDSKVACLAKKGKHRVEEGVDATKDKSNEIKDKVDTH